MKYGSLFSALLLGSAGLVFSLATQAADKTQIVKILDGKASVELPIEFTRMPNDILKIAYEDEDRPQEAWYVESEDCDVFITFHVAREKLEEDQVSKATDAMKAELSEFSPAISQVKVNSHQVGRLEFNVPDDEGNGYMSNMLQVSSFNGKMMFVAFFVTNKLESKYKPAGKAALSSLKY